MLSPALGEAVNAYHLFPLLQTFFSLGLALLVLRGHGGSRVHRLFAAFLLSIALYGFLIFRMRRSPDTEAAFLWERGLVPLAPLMAVLFFLFAARYTYWNLRRWIPWLLLAFCALTVPSAFTGAVFSGMRQESFGYSMALGWLFPPWSAFCTAVLAASIFRLLSAARSTASAEERNRLYYILTGILAAFLGGILDILPVTGLPSYPGLVIGILIFLVLTAIAILKHNLLDIRRIVRESLAFTLTGILLGALPVAFLAVSGLLGGPLRLTPAGLLLVLLLTMGLPPLWLQIRRRIDHWIHGDRLSSLEALGRFTRETQRLDGPEDSSLTMVRLFAGALRSERAWLFLPYGSDGRFVPYGGGIPAVPAGTRLTKADSPFSRWLAAHGEAVFLRELQFIPGIQGAIDGERDLLRRMDTDLIVPLRTQDGRLSGIVAVCRRKSGQPLNLEDRDLASALSRQMAVKLENERLFRDAVQGRAYLEEWLHGMSECVVITGPDAVVRFANRSAAGQFGIAVGDRFPFAPPSSDGSGVAIAGRLYDVTSAPLADPGGIASSIHAFRDVTERLEREKEAARSQKLESLGLLAAGIAHDFNNILTAIIGSLDVAVMDAPGPIAERLSVTRGAAVRATKLTRQLLAFSKGWTPVVKSVPARELLEETARFVLAGTNVRVDFAIPEDTWRLKIDEGQIGQVIGNMLLNASQSMPDGGSIELATENVTLQTGRAVRISITDHGAGIPKDVLPLIFDPYFTTKPQGSGLGLTVAYSIVRKHGGRIDVVSREGAGTTFTLHLPAGGDDAPAPAAARPLRGNGRILVADDEPAVRAVAEDLLSRLGYTAESVGDGEEALAAYERARREGKPFDAVILDLTIPGGMGGRAAVRRIRDMDPDACAIVSSGYSEDPALTDPKTFGFDAMVAKPYRVEDLAAALHAALSDRRPRASTEAPAAPA